MNNKNTVTILMIATVIIAIIGGTFAYWNWQSTSGQRTNVTFTVAAGFTCGADGGGDITSSDVTLAPAACTNPAYAIQRTVRVSTTQDAGKEISLDMWLKVNNIGSGLSQSENFKYALTTNSSSCTTDVITAGTFNGTSNGSELPLLSGKEYEQTTANDTYYLYIWLDAAETSQTTMNQPFNITIEGSCTDELGSSSCPSMPTVALNNSVPNAPVLDDGLIPVTIANDGTVTAVASNNPSWYDYSNKQWANAVLVRSGGKSDNDTPRAKNRVPGTIIDRSDILAYFVWIPRYKYAFPDPQTMTCGCIPNVNETDYVGCYGDVEKSCRDIANVNEIDYPGCYDYDSGMSSGDRELLKAFIINDGMPDSAADECIENQGSMAGCLPYYLEQYNEANDPDIEVTTTYVPNNTIVTNELMSNKQLNYPRTIDIVFEAANATKSTGTATGTSYYTHPAFTFGSEELPGFWVGKFETSGNATLPQILPNVASLRNQNVSTQFATSLKFAGGSQSGSAVTFAGNNTYGVTSTADSHMMKNSEWGAVAYLSHSNYGINDEIRINSYWNNGTLTGCGASTANAAPSTTCGIAYGSATSYPQSTTGNISGIFDMSGGAWEYVMGHWSDNLSTPSYERSGLSTLPASKYIDIYPSGTFTGNQSTNITFCTLETCGGHALYETANWYDDDAYFVYSGSPWFVRGGYYGGGVSAGAWVFSCSNGDGGDGHSWRGVLVAR